tara:strand:- start:302 stop:409 length:108 start_codon:yes stop_codon:yes gene_type:complete
MPYFLSLFFFRVLQEISKIIFIFTFIIITMGKTAA